MNVLVDTCVWSLALRRRADMSADVNVQALTRLIQQDAVVVVGPVRQEILSGIRDASRFSRIRDKLRAFSDLPLTPEDFEAAAGCFNRCRAKGLQGSNTDFLLCAVAERYRLALFSTDKDFAAFRQHIDFPVYQTV